jgi:hypothetical protein
MARKLGDNLGVDAYETVNIVEELELAQRAQVGTLRAAAVRRVHTPVLVRPANSVDRELVVASGHARALWATGVSTLLARPAMVGSFFLVEFDRDQIDLAPVLARCDLCAMHGESEFEARFAFVQRTVIPESGTAPEP